MEFVFLSRTVCKCSSTEFYHYYFCYFESAFLNMNPDISDSMLLLNYEGIDVRSGGGLHDFCVQLIITACFMQISLLISFACV